jgi:hypothetical protein
VTESSFAEHWVGCYTRGLPRESRADRRDEIASDVYEQVAAHGDHRGVRLAIVGRTLRGGPGDLMWRLEEGRAMRNGRRAESGQPGGWGAAWAACTQAWFAPLAVLVGLFNVLLGIGVLVDENGKMPGQVVGPIIMFILAGALFTGLWMRWRSRYGAPAKARSARSMSREAVGLRVAAIAGVMLLVAGIIGMMLALVAGVVLLGAVGVAVLMRRTAASRADIPGTPRAVALADVLLIVGTLPALAFFWMVIPPILALLVIGGVIGTGPGARREAVI